MVNRYYGTLGPACKDKETLKKMYMQGMNGVRLNLSHSDLEQCEELLTNYFQAAEGILEHPELLIDLRGPELRIGKMVSDIRLEAEEKVYFVGAGKTGNEESNQHVKTVVVPQEVLEHMAAGQQVLLDDGKILAEIISTSDDGTMQTSGMICGQVLRGGILSSGKSIALPGCNIMMPTLTDMDKKNLAVAVKYGVTGVMLPFVRGVEDLETLRNELKKSGAEHIRIFAKIENLEGVAKLEELIPACDEIVIARGDLGNSVPLWELPVLQEQIADTCRRMDRDFMVVTQMLATMEHSAVPTRAEVSDIFRAVSQGASSVMLTAETAVGEYPVESIEYLVKTAEAAKKYYMM